MEHKFLASPLDLQRNGRMARARALGLTPDKHSSFEINQSFPRLSRKFKQAAGGPPLAKAGHLPNPDGTDGVSFSTRATANSLRADSTADCSSWLQEESFFDPNPHKGVLTINTKTAQIVVTNTLACKMLGYSAGELTGTSFGQLVVREKSDQALPDMLFKDNGDMVIFNGRVVELQCKDGSRAAFSMWLTPADTDDGELYVAVVEPVQRVVSHALLDEFGAVLHADDLAPLLFHCAEHDFVGHNIIKFVPNLLWPAVGQPLTAEMRLQRTTGSNQSSQSFPLTLRLDPYQADDDADDVHDDEADADQSSALLPFCQVALCVYTNLSGMVLIDAGGCIVDCNSIFSQLALGYSRAALIGTNLSDLVRNYCEPLYGRYQSEVRHQNGSWIAVSYFVNEPVAGYDVFQVWMAVASTTANAAAANGSVSLDLTRGSRCHGNPSPSAAKAAANGAGGHDHSEMANTGEQSSLFRDDMVSGDYAERYHLIKQLGSGGFGCVYLAARQSDDKVVVTKFIKKSRVYPESWIEDEDGERVPYEVHFLRRLRHGHVVDVLEVLHNEAYYQLVMAKHGFGMDLFEFIEKTNGVDEPLAAHIFGQVASAVEYLHGQGVLHRDIKDENIVIDEHFSTKLIDFGSAAPLLTDRRQPYTTFCGTFEYCSPEVLRGEPYLGPELEVWAMGVTLYVLVFGRSPFAGVAEILRQPLEVPLEASPPLDDLLRRMMERDVGRRCAVADVGRHVWTSQPVDVDQYDFFDVCDLAADAVEFQNSRYHLPPPSSLPPLPPPPPPAATTTTTSVPATSTPYKRALPFSTSAKKDRSAAASLFDLEKDDSIHFQVPELVFHDASSHSQHLDD